YMYYHTLLLTLHSFPTRRSSDLTPYARPPAFPPSPSARSAFACPGRSQGSSPRPAQGGRCLPVASQATQRLELAARSPHSHAARDRKSTRLNSSHVSISYAVFCL